MSTFIIHGGKPLKGSLEPQGSKNEAFQVMCAALLTSEPVKIHNVPDILDIHILLKIFTLIGVRVQKLDAHSYQLQADSLSLAFTDESQLQHYASKMRGFVLILGPLLARLGKAIIPLPGGDKIGKRRLDTHFIGMHELGATFSYHPEKKAYLFEAQNLVGKYILLDESSVTGTANIIMAAVLAKGRTTIYNAACEPHIQQLCNMLVKMGGEIAGIGSNLLHIDGVAYLKGTEHKIGPDMLEIGSIIGLAAMTKSHIKIPNAIDDQFLDPVLSRFRSLGIQIDLNGTELEILPQETYTIQTDLDTRHIPTFSDAVWPGFPSDLLSILLVTAIQAQGSTLIHQKMYESRLFFVDNLIQMGAKLVLCDPHRVHVIGLNRSSSLKGIRMTSPDIRAGIALLIAALSAEGESIIEHATQIDRGYQSIEIRLRSLGADMERIDETVK